MELPSQSARYIGNKNDPNVEQFLSQNNVDYLQNAVIRSVYKETSGNIAIGKQSEQELRLIMIQTLQSEYNQRPFGEMNTIVVNKCKDIILRNVGMYVRYMNDMNKNPTSLQIPQGSRDSREKFSKTVF